jgi:molybdopterin converting factor small subunit
MIKVRCAGHIRSSLGTEELNLEVAEISSSELLVRLRVMGKSDPRLGFTKYNTLLIVNGGEVYTAAADDRLLRDGDTVLLLPFSHGG